MSSLIVEVVPFTKEPIPNSDFLSVAKVKGWQCVVRTSDFENVDKAIYIPIDSIVPDTEQFAFLDRPAPGVSEEEHRAKLSAEGAQFARKKYRRVKTIKLRGVISQGILLPTNGKYKIGDDVAAELGITKWEPPADNNTRRIFGSAGSGFLVDNPTLFHKYTEIENFRNFPEIIKDGEEVVCCEKVHGCLQATTKIRMADYATKEIKDIEPGEYVLGMDEQYRVIPVKVLNKFDNGISAEWIDVQGTRRAAGRGNHYFSVKCTPNHRFWLPSQSKYVAASDLRIGDKVALLRNEAELCPLQKQVLLGKMIGDGSLQIAKNGTAAVNWGHSESVEEYVDWTNRALGEYASRGKGHRTSGYGTSMVASGSSFNYQIAEYLSDFLPSESSKKTIPPWVADELGPIGLAFWYMDDGSLSHNDEQEDRVLFAVCGFAPEDCNVLIRALGKFGISAVYYESNGHPRLRLNSTEAEKFFLLIAPYIPPVMQYKLPERYRGHNGWLPSVDSSYKPLVVFQTITSVKPWNSGRQSRRKWDLETETHNFFANGVLVHNSNLRLACVDGEFIVGSHNKRHLPSIRMKSKLTGFHKLLSPLYKVIPSIHPSTEMKNPFVFWRAVKDLDIKHKLEKMCELLSVNSIIVFGEVFGVGVQDLTYGRDSLDIRIFDISANGMYLNWDDVVLWADFLGLQTVPVLYRGNFSVEELKKHTDGMSVLAPHQIREGCVVHPVEERWHPNLGRVILKSVSDAYLLRKGGTEDH